MKKILAILLAVLLTVGVLFALAACEEDKEIIIRVLENDTAKKEGYLDYLLNAFNEKYAGQNVKAVDANMDEYSNLELDGPYGHGPDVLYQANDVLMKYVDGHHVMPIDVQSLDCYDEIPQNAWNAYKADNNGQTVYCGIPGQRAAAVAVLPQGHVAGKLADGVGRQPKRRARHGGILERNVCLQRADTQQRQP